MTKAANEDLLEIRIDPQSGSIGKQVVELGLPSTAIIVLLTRGADSYIPQGSTVLKDGDVLLLATRRQDQEELKRFF
jgi:NhaP-type Na+/H+ and K+/H+ antiporter